jgi:hypothetical protein
LLLHQEMEGTWFSAAAESQSFGRIIICDALPKLLDEWRRRKESD